MLIEQWPIFFCSFLFLLLLEYFASLLFNKYFHCHSISNLMFQYLRTIKDINYNRNQTKTIWHTTFFLKWQYIRSQKFSRPWWIIRLKYFLSAKEIFIKNFFNKSQSAKIWKNLSWKSRFRAQLFINEKYTPQMQKNFEYRFQAAYKSLKSNTTCDII